MFSEPVTGALTLLLMTLKLKRTDCANNYTNVFKLFTPIADINRCPTQVYKHK